VECSSGTYVRALARDLGAALGVGGHLTALRRTRVGPFTLDRASTLDVLAQASDPITLPLADAVRAAFPVRPVDDAEARELSFGRSLAPRGIDGVHGAFLADGSVVALLRETDGAARPVLVFTPAG
jgi:tRNA pseudouridine55 synthase